MAAEDKCSVAFPFGKLYLNDVKSPVGRGQKTEMYLYCKKNIIFLYISNLIRYNNMWIRNGGSLKWDERKSIKKQSYVERHKC